MLLLALTFHLLIQWVHGVTLTLPGRSSECMVVMPHDKLENAEGSFVISEGIRVDFSVTVIANNWVDSGKEIYRRNYQNAATFDIKAGDDVPVGFVYRLCWNNTHNDNSVFVFFKRSTMLIGMNELEQTGQDIYKVAKLLGQLENQLEQEVSDFRIRSDASESTLEQILWVNILQFVLVVSMAVVQARSLRKLFETQLMI